MIIEALETIEMHIIMIYNNDLCVFEGRDASLRQSIERAITCKKRLICYTFIFLKLNYECFVVLN